MLLAFLHKHINRLYFYALILIAVGLPTSKFLMSVGAIGLASVWVVEGKYREKINRLIRNKTALILISVYFLHLLGLFYTNNFSYAFTDLRIKLPLFTLPFVLGSIPPLPFGKIKQILFFFLGAVAFTTLYSLFVLLEVIPTKRDISDVRNISPFISHVRFSLQVAYAVLLLIYLLWKNSYRRRPLYLLFIFWFITYLYILESPTGFIALLIGGITLLIYLLIRAKDLTTKAIYLVLTVVLIGGPFFFISSYINDYYTVYQDLSDLDEETPYGEKYTHYLDNKTIENGYYIWTYIAHKELKTTWNERSNIPLDSLDNNGNPIYGTVIRYLTSKGLRKDKNGVLQLSKRDIEAIENGIPTVRYRGSGLAKRINQIIFEFDVYLNGGDPSGNSVTQRMEFWKAGWHIFKNNWLIGIGTGDVQDKFNQAYSETDTRLNKDNWLRAHNQYLTVLVTFGVIGFLLFVVSLIWPIVLNPNKIDFIYISFFVIAIISFLGEDTLETQAGVTFFAFFNSLLLLARKDNPINS